MGEALVVVLVISGAAVTVATALGMRTAAAARQRREWSRAAQHAGLADIEDGGAVHTTLRGRFEQLEIRVREERGPVTQITVDAPGLLPASLELRAEGTASALEKLVDGPDLEIGDQEFDAAVMVKGNPVLVTAVLDEATRRGVLDLVQQKGRVHDGSVVLALNRRIETRTEMEQLLTALIQLARNLCSPWSPAASMAANARHDPLPTVRLRNLQLLGERFPNHDETRAAMEAALGDPDSAVRLEAACRRGAAAREVLLGITDDPDAPDDVASRALRALGPDVGCERILAALARALRTGRNALALTAIELLGQAGGSEAVARLSTILAAGDEGQAVAAARALGATADSAAETALLHSLSCPGADLLLAVIEALGHAGTVKAVPVLRGIIGSRPLDRTARKACTAAIAAIQARTTGAAPGQLAVSGLQAGELSLAEEAQGELSLSDEDQERS